MWRALGGEEPELEMVVPGGYPALRSNLDVASLTRDAVAAASLAAALLAHDEAWPATVQNAVSLDADRILTSVTSERHFRLGGEPPHIWSEFSGFWPAGEGWVRTHANYRHHRARLLLALKLPTDAAVADFAERLTHLEPLEVEELVTDAGGVAVAVRTPAEWARHPQAKFVRSQPLIGKARIAPSDTSRIIPRPTDTAAPLAGLRVLDLTRVIAGPVATRTLALLGADVLRIDTPSLPEFEWQHLDTGAGKRSTLLNLNQTADRRTFEDLLQDADVLISGYRQGSLERYGLAPEELAERRPGLIIGRINAWGSEGPWAERRGFDSIVQAVSGIASLESPDGIRPGALPAQALDHSAGYMLAAAAISSLRSKRQDRGTWLVEVSLARIAQELLSLTQSEETGQPGPPQTATVDTPSGLLTYALPALSFTDGPTDWTAPSLPWGADHAAWNWN